MQISQSGSVDALCITPVAEHSINADTTNLRTQEIHVQMMVVWIVQVINARMH